MARKLFIVHRGNESLFRTLTNTLENELDVLSCEAPRTGASRRTFKSASVPTALRSPSPTRRQHPLVGIV